MNLTSGLKPVFYTPVVNTNELGAEGSTLLSPGSNVGCSGCLAQGHLSTVPRFEVATLQQPIPFLWAMSCPNNAKHRKKKKKNNMQQNISFEMQRICDAILSAIFQTWILKHSNLQISI